LLTHRDHFDRCRRRRFGWWRVITNHDRGEQAEPTKYPAACNEK
jgi:hypothetical protein